LHELATNAAKHGALSKPRGKVAVTWNVDKNRSPDVLELRWQEFACSPVEPPKRESYGLAIP
jgi:two-component sensor histidine kinase